MDEALKQFSKALADELKRKLASEQIGEFVKQAKASGDDRSFEVVMSTSDEDRQGDALEQSNWDLKYFEMNPVLLWAHNYQGFPIGIVDDIRIDGDKAIATGHFAPEGVNTESDLACKLYQEKILRAVSPGYIQNDDGSRELLEVSFCPVPAGRYALSLRQVGRLGVSTRDLVTKGFFYEVKKEKSPQAGETCELEDGSPGVLAKDPKDPGKLVCVPEKDKSAKTETNMDNELTKKIKAEHERHQKCVGKAIDEFKSAMDEEGATEGKAHDDVNDNSEAEKAIDEFKDAVHTEHAEHLEKCMKAIDDTYETMGREENKSIDEFKSEMKAEHLKHVKACDKAIDEFKSDHEEADGEDGHEKAFKKCEKAFGDELERHEKAHMDMCKAEAMGEGEEDGKGEKKGLVADQMSEDEERQAKYKNLDRAYSVFYAFTSAYMDDGVGVGDFEKLLDEAVALMKDVEAEVKGKMAKHYAAKAGRAISAKNREAIEKVVKDIEDYHTKHGEATEQVTAALKAIMASGDGGEETKPEEKSGAAPKPRSSTSGASAELESYLLTQRLARQVKTAAEGALRQINEKIKENYSRGK